MVQSRTATVDEFLDGVGPERIAAVTLLRDACRTNLPGWVERMQWGMPGYGPPGSDAVVCFNDQKGYISLYPGRDALEPYRDRFKGASFGKGCVRFPKPDRIDFGVVAEILRHVYREKG